MKELSATHEHLSTATGFWDLADTQIIFDDIKNYKSLRLIIGQEPSTPRYRNKLVLEAHKQDFLDIYANYDLSTVPKTNDTSNLLRLRMFYSSAKI